MTTHPPLLLQNLSNIIWGCVTLGHTPDKEWMQQYYNALDVRISGNHGRCSKPLKNLRP